MLIYAGDKIISEPQLLESMIFSPLASGTLVLGLLLSERIVYIQFAHLSIYPSTSSKGNQGGSEEIKRYIKNGDLEQVIYWVREWKSGQMGKKCYKVKQSPATVR